MSDVLGQGARGGAVTVLGQGIKLCIQLISVIILARLLSPDDFGVVAMAAVFIALGTLLRDFGMPTAALQTRSLSNQQASNMFWANSALGLVAAIVLVACTPLVVAFYGEERLWPVLPVLALTLVISGVQAQLQVQLARNMRFVSLISTDVLAHLLGLAVAVGLALAGFSYWALILQLVTVASVLLISRAIAARWVPSAPRRGHETQALLVRGGHFGVTQLLTFIASNADTISIGSRWGAGPLGYYNRAFELLAAPISGVLGPLTNVIVPTANSIAAQGRSIGSFLLRLQFAVGVGLVWVFATGAALAPRLIPFVFGAGWEPSVLLFQLLAIGGAFQTFSYISYWAFIVHHQSKQLLYYNLVTKCLSVILVVGAVPFGVAYVAAAYSLSLALSWPINLFWLRRVADQQIAPFLRNGLRLLFAGAVAFAAGAFALRTLPAMHAVFDMLLTGLVSTAVFALAIILVPGGIREFKLSVGPVLDRLRHPRG